MASMKMGVKKFKNVEMCNSCDPSKARFTMEDDLSFYYIDINLDDLSVIDCTFKTGTYPQALMLTQAVEYLRENSK